jgi:hypothetical protein
MLEDSINKNTNYSDEVLLMTASIAPGKTPTVAIQDPNERCLQYIISLLAWIELTNNIKTIIFCENTNTQYDFSRLVEFARQKGKILEVLVFSGNVKAQIYGKGYGEGEIIKYAIRHSKHLSNTTNFYKITGRLFVRNFDEIQSSHQHLENIFKCPAFSPDPFINMIPEKPKTLLGYCRAVVRFLYVFFGRGKGRGPHDYTKHISTVFYKSNVKFFKKNLLNSYKRVNDNKSYNLEHVFYEDIINKNFSPFLKPYIIVGRSGSQGYLYPGGDYSEELKNRSIPFMQKYESDRFDCY